jgi:DNA-binding response OmpR family regulator
MNQTRIDRLPATILIIEPDPLMLTALGAMVDMHGHRAVLARTEEVASGALGQRPIDVIVLSIENLSTGCAFADRLRNCPAMEELPIIFLVPEQTLAWTKELGQRGGVYSLMKPYQPEALWELIAKTLWLPHVAVARTRLPKAPVLHQRDWISLH